MLKLLITSPKVQPEFVYKEYVPYFDWLSSRSLTPYWISTDFPELFTSKNIVPLGSTRDTKKLLSVSMKVPVKYIQSTLLQRQAISPDEKLYKQFDLNPKEPIVVPKASRLLKYLDKLKTATKIVTWQDIFAHFAMVHDIPCLIFYDAWNPNPYKDSYGVKILTADTANKTKIIDDWLTSPSI